jgi:hypothetical protein
MFSFFRRRKEADATARRIINQGRFLGARTQRESVEMLWGRPLSENEWVRSASVWERIWQESLKESEMPPPHQMRLAISAVTDESVSGKNATEIAANAVALMKVLGIEEFHRGFDTIQESYSELVRSRPKILEGISNACEAWFKNPGTSEFERLVELFKIARTHVVQK